MDLHILVVPVMLTTVFSLLSLLKVQAFEDRLDRILEQRVCKRLKGEG